MKVEYDGQEYTLDLDEIDVKQARTMQTHAGLTLGTLGEKLNDMDTDAMTAVFWLMLQQSGKGMPFDQVNFKVIPFATAIGEAFEAEQEAEKAAAKAAGKPAKSGPKAATAR